MSRSQFGCCLARFLALFVTACGRLYHVSAGTALVEDCALVRLSLILSYSGGLEAWKHSSSEQPFAWASKPIASSLSSCGTSTSLSRHRGRGRSRSSLAHRERSPRRPERHLPGKNWSCRPARFCLRVAEGTRANQLKIHLTKARPRATTEATCLEDLNGAVESSCS